MGLEGAVPIVVSVLHTLFFKVPVQQGDVELASAKIHFYDQRDEAWRVRLRKQGAAVYFMVAQLEDFLVDFLH